MCLFTVVQSAFLMFEKITWHVCYMNFLKFTEYPILRAYSFNALFNHYCNFILLTDEVLAFSDYVFAMPAM